MTHIFSNFPSPFPFFASGNAVSVSECCILVSECRLYFRMWLDRSETSSKFQNVISVSEDRFLFSIRLLFQNIALHFQKVVSCSEFCVLVSECHLHFGMV